MNARNKTATLVILTILFSGCAITTKGKILRNSILAGAAGAAYGNTREDYKTTHATMYGASAMALATLVSLYAYDPDEKIDVLQKETTELKEKLDQFEKPTLINQGKSLFKSPLPNSLVKLVQPGEWKHYKLDQWVQDPSDSNIWLRQVEMYEVIPPSTGNQ